MICQQCGSDPALQISIDVKSANAPATIWDLMEYLLIILSRDRHRLSAAFASSSNLYE
jgi:hypothetical protein